MLFVGAGRNARVGRTNAPRTAHRAGPRHPVRVPSTNRIDALGLHGGSRCDPVSGRILPVSSRHREGMPWLRPRFHSWAAYSRPSKSRCASTTGRTRLPPASFTPVVATPAVAPLVPCSRGDVRPNHRGWSGDRTEHTALRIPHTARLASGRPLRSTASRRGSSYC
jgi:hypothetical protein